MSPPPLPDLSKLSGTEKDRLIETLYETLLAVEGQTRSLPAGAGQRASLTTAELRNQIAGTAPSRRAQTSSYVPAASWLNVLNARPLQILLLVLGFGFAADYAVGWYQRQVLANQRKAELALRSAAFSGLYVELVRVAYEPDRKSYRATLTMQNANMDAPLYVMMSPVRIFVQVGRTWQETPVLSAPDAGSDVTRLLKGQDFSVVFRTDVKGWAQLIPGYMHVRIDNQMLISLSSTPKEDIVERNNVFYVYLKPQGADDAEIRRRSRFPGAPPVFIPMPPH